MAGLFWSRPSTSPVGKLAAQGTIGPARGQLPPRTGFSPISSPSATDTICQAHSGMSHSPRSTSGPASSPSTDSPRLLELGFPELLGTRRTLSVCVSVHLSPGNNFESTG